MDWVWPSENRSYAGHAQQQNGRVDLFAEVGGFGTTAPTHEEGRPRCNGTALVAPRVTAESLTKGTALMLEPPEPPAAHQPRTALVTFGAACESCDHGHDDDTNPCALEDRIVPAHGDHGLSWCAWCSCGWEGSLYYSLVSAVVEAHEHPCEQDAQPLAVVARTTTTTERWQSDAWTFTRVISTTDYASTEAA